MYKAKIVIFMLFIFLFAGCQNDNFEKSLKDDVLIKKDRWYEVDSYRDKFETYKFSESQFIVEVYSDKTFKELIES